MKHRDLIKKLEAAGYKLARDGDHSIYEKRAADLYKSQNIEKSTSIQQNLFERRRGLYNPAFRQFHRNIM